MTNRLVALLILGTLFLSCARQEKSQQQKASNASFTEFNFQSKVKYAKGFTIKNHDTWKELVVFDEWKGDTLGYYALVLRGKTKPDKLPAKVIVIQVPISNIACLSSTHVAALALLNEQNRITGVSNPQKIWNKDVAAAYKAGKVVSIGRQMNNNIEQILALSPEVLMKSAYENVRNDDVRITEAKIPIVYNVEWMEPALLGRAEWLKFVSAFFCKEREADSIFSRIETNFHQAQQLTKLVKNRPTVLLGLDYKGAWHMSGAKSYVAAMLDDAGATFKGNINKDEQPLSFEQVLDQHGNDDKWLNWMTPGISSIEFLGKMNERYKLFKAFQTGEIYNHDKRLNAYGGNDFWESGVYRPDLLLKDLIKIFHPDLLPDYQTVYWRKLPLK